jgi:hypothetical protein
VEASLFAFQSPLQNGVILADEVGLGKTIEAGLVVCQYWSERKRKIIIIAPASLRKQWSMELREKFFIDSVIIDGQTFSEEKAKGNKNPFIQKDKVVITSYPFASKKEELLALGEVLKGTDILVLSDEMYEKIMYNGKKFTACAEVSEDMYKRTVTINGLSKAVAMTGWRFGYIATPDAALAKALTKLQGQVTSNINTMTQYAAIPALEGDADETIEMMRVEFEKRKNIAVKSFNEIKGLSTIDPDGAFYLFINIQEVTNDSMKFCSELLEQKGSISSWTCFWNRRLC